MNNRYLKRYDNMIKKKQTKLNRKHDLRGNKVKNEEDNFLNLICDCGDS